MADYIFDAGRRAQEAMQRDVADAVIIGSGAAGATAARVLSRAGWEVVVLEEGSPVNHERLRQDTWSGFRDHWRDAGLQAAEGRSFVPILQGRCVGGTTVINGAIIHRLPEPILETWAQPHHFGERLTHDDLSRVFDELDVALGVAETPEAALGANNRLMRAGTERLGWKGNVIRRNVRGCEGSSRCLQACPTQRKQAMHVSFLPEAGSLGARVHAEAEVTRIDVEGGRALRVHCRSAGRGRGAPGAPLVVEARRAVLLAASAIQSPLLLHASGLAGSSGLCGRRLQGHPGTSVLGLFDTPVRMWQGATQGYESLHFWPERMKLESIAVPLEVLGARLSGFGPGLWRQLEQAPYLAQWGVQIRAHTHGSVHRRWLSGGAKVRFSLRPEDVRLLQTGVRRLAEMMFAAGAKAVFPGVYGLPEVLTSPDQAAAIEDLTPDPRRFHCIMAHLFGTAVAGPDPSTSVTTQDGRVHGVSNLWVVDSSTFPTNIGVNPQHVICAMSQRSAEHIRDAAPL